MIITEEIFKAIQPGEVFRVITTKYQTFHEPGKAVLTFVAVKGWGNDWVIYAGRAEQGARSIQSHGDKVAGEALIKSLVPCDESVFKRYRY